MSHLGFSVVVGAIALVTTEAYCLRVEAPSIAVFLAARVVMWAGALALLSADMAACTAGVMDVWTWAVAVGAPLGGAAHYFVVHPMVMGAPNLHGSAQWANEREIKGAGLLEEPCERLEADEVLFVEPQPCNAPTVKLVTPPPTSPQPVQLPTTVTRKFNG